MNSQIRHNASNATSKTGGLSDIIIEPKELCQASIDPPVDHKAATDWILPSRPYRRKVHKTFHGMLRRCNDPRQMYYEKYGGRGIKVLFASPEEFHDYIGDPPSLDHTVDRYPNNDGNYEPGNVRWATRSQQQNNRHSKYDALTHNGLTMSARQWAVHLGIPYHRVKNRLGKGQSIAMALDADDRREVGTAGLKVNPRVLVSQ